VREELEKQNILDAKAIIVSPDGTWAPKLERLLKRKLNDDSEDPSESMQNKLAGRQAGKRRIGSRLLCWTMRTMTDRQILFSLSFSSGCKPSAKTGILSWKKVILLRIEKWEGGVRGRSEREE